MIVHTIRVFPDTGHHIVFLPLIQEGSTPQTGHDLPNLSAEQADWVREQCGDSDWVFGNKKPWLRSRFGRKPLAGSSNPDDMLLGLWVALETNIGTPARGYVIQGKAREEAGATYRGQKIVSTTQKRSGTADPIVGNPYIAGPGEALEETQSIDLSEAFGFTDILSDVTLEVVWVEAAGEPVTVDIIVDFGNSRTVVLALERIPGAGGFASICRPILFPGPGWDVDSLNYDEVNFDQVIPESWFTLMDPVFPVSASRDSTEAKSVSASSKKSLFGRGQSATSVAVKRAPHMFSDISPAVVGPAAKKVLSKLDVDEGGLSFLSSPKRYVWDDQPTGLRGDTFWTMNAQPWRKPQISRNRLTPLHGEILRFMPEAEADWSLDGTVSSWPGAEEINEDRRPNHSRADSLTWVALSIMEQAQRQIHSETWRKGNQPFLPRKLGRMLVTYPAGWTEEEINAYHKKWSFARDIFAVSRLDNPMALAADSALPEVALELDEAVAPQLAIIFSEIHHMRDYGENWIELYGRNSGNQASVRVMTIDIGGGTTDTSIVEYRDELEGVGVDLTATLLFKDSSTIAGDRLVRDIIERVLLPQLGVDYEANSAERDKFERFFFSRANRDGERAQWSVISRTVFIPIVHQWLRSFSDGSPENPETGRAWTPLEAGAAIEQIDRFNAMAADAGLDGTLLRAGDPFAPDYEVLRQTIQDWFLYIADTHARYLAVFDCDLVILTGKPSELPEIRELLEQRLPIVSNRILSGKGYYAGDWLPLTRDGRIPDAKLVTALGGAVYRGVQTGLISGWRIRGQVDEPYRMQNYWGRIAGEPKPFLSDDVLLAPDQEEADVRLMTGSFIGRARFLNHVLPEQVYVLQWDKADSEGHKLVDIKLRRRQPSEGGNRYAMSAESLELVSATDAQTGKKLPLSHLKLRLCTLPQAEEHWQDTGRFEVRWPNRR